MKQYIFFKKWLIKDANLNKIKISVGGDNWAIPSSDPAAPVNKTYSGIWETADVNGATEVFRGFNVNYEDSQHQKRFIFGTYNSSGSGDFGHFDFQKDAAHIYDLKSKKWGSYKVFDSASTQVEKTKTRIKKMLKDFYDPFKNKKGRWSDFSTSKLCEEAKNARVSGSEELEKIKSFCYRQR